MALHHGGKLLAVALVNAVGCAAMFKPEGGFIHEIVAARKKAASSHSSKLSKAGLIAILVVVAILVVSVVVCAAWCLKRNRRTSANARGPKEDVLGEAKEPLVPGYGGPAFSIPGFGALGQQPYAPVSNPSPAPYVNPYEPPAGAQYGYGGPGANGEDPFHDTQDHTNLPTPGQYQPPNGPPTGPPHYYNPPA